MRRQCRKARLVKQVNTVDLKSALLESYRFKSDSEQTNTPSHIVMGAQKTLTANFFPHFCPTSRPAVLQGSSRNVFCIEVGKHMPYVANFPESFLSFLKVVSKMHLIPKLILGLAHALPYAVKWLGGNPKTFFKKKMHHTWGR